ncbi:SHOCT domain-containing protein [Natrinema longum]|uniref:SHOCT domain-containing protein n=1 Tax=Natrinema longum TaxID=370324 RepID=A0A8A2UDM4_9EURY|nr:SHOCT domain-containing protein [Natrinema longum]MBZ6496074.1 SHOCT domain-containing protein [Natrinema longum]QSW85998.1 SHOCT domain-containing protein [Natrinema longum]
MSASEGPDHGRDAGDPWTRLRENAVRIVSLLVTAIWLGGLLTGQSWWLPVLVVGYAAVLPIVTILFGDETAGHEWSDDETETTESEPTRTDSPSDAGGTRDALETLRERYAAGELTDEQFERKLERLLGTKTVENAREWTREGDRERTDGREREYDR